MFEIINIVLFLLNCGGIIYGIHKLKEANSIKIEKEVKLAEQKNIEQNIKKAQHELKKVEQTIQFQNNYIKKQNQEIQVQNKELIALTIEVQQKKENIQADLDKTYKVQSDILQQRLADFKKTSNQAAEHYVETLEKDYEAADAAHAQHLARLQAECNEATAALNNLKETRKAAYEAILKQQEVKQNKDNYRLLPTSFELDDIHSLEKIKPALHKPRILSMLIWQSFWQPLAKQKFPVILQDKTKTGIYKITNLLTNECYIGQSVDVYKRWTSHCKAGLGIDTPVGNKLYKAIQKDGLQNFTFELLCECPKEQLDNKERYFISLYQADVYGYNSTIGNK